MLQMASKAPIATKSQHVTNGLEMGSKWDPNGIQMGSKWDPNGIQMGSKWEQYIKFLAAKIDSETCRNLVIVPITLKS